MGSRGLVTALRGLGGTERRGMETPATVIGKQRTSRRSESHLRGRPAEALSKGSGVSGVQPPLEPVSAARRPCRWPASPVCRGRSIIPTLCPRFQLNCVVVTGIKSPENRCFTTRH